MDPCSTNEMDYASSSEDMDHMTIVDHDGSVDSRESLFEDTDEAGYYASGESDGGLCGPRPSLLTGRLFCGT